jgi:hypothetical protein
MSTPRPEDGGQSAAEATAVVVHDLAPAEARPGLIQGRRPTEEQAKEQDATEAQWRKVRDEWPVETLKRLEDAAKQLVALTGTLQALYLAAFALSDIRKRVTEWWGLLLYLVPVALWLGSQYCATKVYIPRPQRADLTSDQPNFWQALRTAILNAGEEKHRWLTRAHVLLVLSGGVVLLLLIGLVFLPTPKSGPTEVVLLTPTPR